MPSAFVVSQVVYQLASRLDRLTPNQAVIYADYGRDRTGPQACIVLEADLVTNRLTLVFQAKVFHYRVEYLLCSQ